MKQVKTSQVQMGFDFVVDTQVKTVDNKIVTQTSVFNLPKTTEIIETASNEFTTNNVNDFIAVIESDNKEVVTLINNEVTTTITKKAYKDTYVIRSVKGEKVIVNELDSFTFKRNFYYYI